MKGSTDLLQAFLATPRKITIIMHHKPDADALGSSLGWSGYLKKKGHQVTVISPSDYPQFLAWLPDNDSVVVHQKNNSQELESIIKDSELIFCLDFSSLSRINDLGEMVRHAPGKKGLIDHHLEPERFADFEKWDQTAASTAELVFDLIKELGDESLVDADIASCLYAGIMTDTGGFRHNTTSQKVFLTAAELVSRGANPHKISKLIYDNNSLDRLQLMGYVLANKLNVLQEFRTSYISLSAKELKEHGSQTGDTEGLVNYALSIRDVVLSALIYERSDGTVKLSLRSQGDFSVNEMARNHFQGGGHKNAAGGQSNLTLEQTVNKFVELLPIYKEKLLEVKE